MNQNTKNVTPKAGINEMNKRDSFDIKNDYNYSSINDFSDLPHLVDNSVELESDLKFDTETPKSR